MSPASLSSPYCNSLSGYQGHSSLLHHPHRRPRHHGPGHTLRLQLRHQADTDGELLEEHNQRHQDGRQSGVLTTIVYMKRSTVIETINKEKR